MYNVNSTSRRCNAIYTTYMSAIIRTYYPVYETGLLLELLHGLDSASVPTYLLY